MPESIHSSNEQAFTEFCQQDNFGCRILSSYRYDPNDITNTVMITVQDGTIQNAFSLKGGSAVVCGSESAEETLQALRFLGCRDIFASRKFFEDAALSFDSEGFCACLNSAVPPMATETVTAETLRELYPVIQDMLPAYDRNMTGNWYVELSHKLRHNTCHAEAVRVNNRLVSAALTAAESETAAVIGMVSTLPGFRGNGFAGTVCLSLAHSLLSDGKKVYICCEKDLLPFYEKLGWRCCGEWQQLRIKN